MKAAPVLHALAKRVKQKVSNGPIEAPTDYRFWHIVPAARDSFSDP